MSAEARFTILDHLVVQTFVVYRHQKFSHYEIQLAPTERAARVILLTNDDDIYRAALKAEGSEERFDAAWRPGTRRGGQTVQLLCAMRAHQEAA